MFVNVGFIDDDDRYDVWYVFIWVCVLFVKFVNLCSNCRIKFVGMFWIFLRWVGIDVLGVVLSGDCVLFWVVGFDVCFDCCFVVEFVGGCGFLFLWCDDSFVFKWLMFFGEVEEVEVVMVGVCVVVFWCLWIWYFWFFCRGIFCVFGFVFSFLIWKRD